MNKKIVALALTSVLSLSILSGCSKSTPEPSKETEKVAATTTEQEVTEQEVHEHVAPAPNEEDEGPLEIPIDEFVLGPLEISAVYLEPTDMVPAGSTLSADESDFHLEFDIKANEEGAKMGFDLDGHVPHLKINAWIAPVGEDYPAEPINMMPMNASDGPHYGNNVKLSGFGEYKIKLEIAAPDANSYLVHMSGDSKVEQELWTEPFEYEIESFEWAGPQW